MGVRTSPREGYSEMLKQVLKARASLPSAAQRSLCIVLASQKGVFMFYI